MPALHQFIHSFVDHDAISSHTRHLQGVISGMGLDSQIYAVEWRGERSKAKSFESFTGGRETHVLYQFGTVSPIAQFLAKRPEPVAMAYHNVTPAELIAPWEPLIGAELEVARSEMYDLAPHVRLGIGVSHFNESELRAAGYTSTTWAPVLFDPNELSNEVDKVLDVKLKEAKTVGGSDWLFVGRLAPHKCQHDVIKAFALYQRLYDERARLHIVGGISSHHYWTILRRYIEMLGLAGSVELTGAVSNAALGAYFENADVFVCLSEHEGFGVPLLEAMHHKVPVIAYRAAAVPETLGEGGLLFDDKSAANVATSAHKIVNDAALQASLVAAGQRHLELNTLESAQLRWQQVLTDFVQAN